MGCCLSKKTCPSSSSLIGGSCSVKSPDLNKSAIEKSLKQETEAVQEKLELEESKPRNEEPRDNGKARKEVFVIKHRRSHERCRTTDPEDSTASEEKSTGSNHNPVDVDAILIQCGRLSRSNSAAAKTRRYSGSKRSFDFDRDAEEADAEDGGEEEEAERRIHRQRQRGGDSPRERRRRTPSREREDSKSYRSGSRERRVSKSPGRRSEANPNPNSDVGSGTCRPGKFVSVPATDKASLVMDNGDPSIKRITVKRNVGESSRKSASLTRATTNTSSLAQPSPSPFRRNPLGEIDSNSVAYPPSQGNGNCNKRMMNTENESQGLIKLESGNFVCQKLNPAMNTKTATQAPTRREECEIASSSGTELVKPQIVSRSRSLRKSRDFDFIPEALLSNAVSTLPSYTALLLEDIQNFHQKSVNVNAINSSISKACSIVEAVADLNSTTKQHQRREFNLASKKADLMEPSFDKYVTVKRGSSSLEEQESSGSNSFTGSSGVVQRYSSSSSAESTDRASFRSNNKELYRSPLGVVNFEKQEFDPLNKGGGGGGVGRKRVPFVDDSSRVSAVSMY